MRLDIESLRTFKTVLEYGGITRAAKQLNLTQSAVSHKLARLEERVGRPILMKSGSGFLPTSDGQGLLHYAERIISLHDEAAQHFRSSDLAGKIRLGATEDATSKKLATVLGRFGRIHPNVSLSARVAQSLVLKFWLTTSEVDLAILQVFVDDKEPNDIELWREDLLWVGASDHPTALDRSIPFVSFDKNCFYRLAAVGRLVDTGRSLNVVLECPSKEGVQAGIRNGFGIGLLSRRNLTEGLEELECDLPRLPQVCHVLRSRSSVPSRAERNLTEAILQEMQESS
ncbi:LysR family transcriptional regulator [Mesorhizobium tamadayense]|uniref:LysR family transcriptional regulator n=1 Tax=Mesorhizobium tamadayense TaxID=425306 RepID=A0A3P3EPF3_9HYPH|nr:LysR family transcriptional regulator [Mesorhizobium tamadayense]RRH88290.1 LysR family transcriptional regulator [Mesorhizobium tamadayense]